MKILNFNFLKKLIFEVFMRAKLPLQYLLIYSSQGARETIPL